MDSDVVKTANWDQDRERPKSRQRPSQDQDDEKSNGYSWQ